MKVEEHWNTLDTVAVAQAAINDVEAAADAIAKSIGLAPEKELAKLKAHQKLIAAGMPVLE